MEFYRKDFCSITNAPFTLMMAKLEEIGLTPTDIHHLEYLNDKEVLQYLDGGFRWLKKNKRKDAIAYFEQHHIVPTSMIDISDGLASETLHLSRNSGVGIKLFEETIPIDNLTFDTALEFKLDPIVCALNGGEDYELLFTIRQSDFEKIKKHPDIHFIGHVQEKEKGNVLISKQGTVVPLKAQGWDHFKNS